MLCSILRFYGRAENVIQYISSGYQSLYRPVRGQAAKCLRCHGEVHGALPGKPARKIIQNYIPKPNGNRTVLLCGLFTLFGLQGDVEKEPELIMTIKRGILSIQKGEYDKAESILHAALKLAHEENNEDAITYVYDVLANLAFDLDQIPKAEILFINVMQRLLGNGVQQNDNKVIHISLKLAKIYEKTKNYIKAEAGYQYCIDQMQGKIEAVNEEDTDTAKLWITCLDNFARYLASQNRPSEALVYFKKAYDVSLQSNGKEHEDTALLLSDMATVFNTLGDLDSAISYMEEAIQIGEGLGEMEDLGLIYINLGHLYLLKEIYDKSKYACERGLRHARKYEDKNTIRLGRECLREIKKTLTNAKS